jgi:hypothetical protein
LKILILGKFSAQYYYFQDAKMNNLNHY